MQLISKSYFPLFLAILTCKCVHGWFISGFKCDVTYNCGVTGKWEIFLKTQQLS